MRRILRDVEQNSNSADKQELLQVPPNVYLFSFQISAELKCLFENTPMTLIRALTSPAFYQLNILWLLFSLITTKYTKKNSR